MKSFAIYKLGSVFRPVVINSAAAPMGIPVVESETLPTQEQCAAAYAQFTPMTAQQRADALVARAKASMKISAWQAKAALALLPHPTAGTMLAAAEAAIEAMPDGPEKVVVKAAWENNANFQRSSPTIQSFASQLGLDSAALDQLFATAVALTV